MHNTRLLVWSGQSEDIIVANGKGKELSALEKANRRAAEDLKGFGKAFDILRERSEPNEKPQSSSVRRRKSVA